MKKRTLFLFILIGVGVFAYFTNPDQQQHRVAAKEKLNAIVEKTVERYGMQPNILSSLGLDATSKYLDPLLDRHISSDNYYLFSLTKLSWDEENYTIGIGAFNKVYISNKVDEIAQKAIDDYLKNKMFELIPGIENIFR